jgi:hypothetical protein
MPGPARYGALNAVVLPGLIIVRRVDWLVVQEALSRESLCGWLTLTGPRDSTANMPRMRAASQSRVVRH